MLTSQVECCKLALGGCENLKNLFLYRGRYRSQSIYIAAMVLFKNRYLVMEMVASQGRRLADARVSTQDLSNAIRDSLLGNFGEHGLAASLPALQVKYVNGGTGVCVIRCSRDQYRVVWAAITFITEIRSMPLFLNLLHFSGSVSACRRAALEYDQEKLRLLKLGTAGMHLSLEELQMAESMQTRLAQLDG